MLNIIVCDFLCYGVKVISDIASFKIIKKKMMRLYEKFLGRSWFILGIMVWMHIRVYSFRRDYRVHESIAVIY